MLLGGGGEAAAAQLSTPGFDAICLAGDAVGDGVYFFAPLLGGTPRVTKVDITDNGKMPAVGIIVEKSTSTTCFVQTSGLVENLPFSLSTGLRVFFTNSGLSDSIPGTTGDFAQIAGFATDTDSMVIDLGAPIRRA